MNADGTIYGRYGSRSGNGDDAENDISLEGLAATLEAALALHKNYPANKSTLTAKNGPSPQYKTPEQFPSLNKYTPAITYGAGVAKSCVHCHMVRDADRRERREAKKPFPDSAIYPWPMPSTLGFKLDPKKRATVASVTTAPNLKPGDQLLTANNQPLISPADLQFVLDQAPATGQIDLTLRRSGKTVSTTLPLADGWRRNSDISWRVSTWDFRRMALGGIFMKPVSENERSRLGLSDDDIALRAHHVGQYNDHAVAKRAGIKKDDIIVAFGKCAPTKKESDLITYAVQNYKPGQKISLTYLRDGKRSSVEILQQ